MIIYGSSLSPYVRKTLAYTAEKGIAVQVKQVGLRSQDPEFRAASPFGKMPGFRDGDFAISDSTAIITYLEAKIPEPNLLPAEPRARARTVWFEEFADTVLIAATSKIFFNRFVSPRFLGREGDLAVADKAEREELPPLLDYIERVLPESGFLVEDRITIADIAVASPMVNMAHLGVTVNPSTHPKLAAYLAKIHARPAYAALITAERVFFGG